MQANHTNAFYHYKPFSSTVTHTFAHYISVFRKISKVFFRYFVITIAIHAHFCTFSHAYALLCTLFCAQRRALGAGGALRASPHSCAAGRFPGRHGIWPRRVSAMECRPPPGQALLFGPLWRCETDGRSGEHAPRHFRSPLAPPLKRRAFPGAGSYRGAKVLCPSQALRAFARPASVRSQKRRK